MSDATVLTPIYQHVIFTEPATGFGPVMNFNPAATHPAAAECQLSVEESAFVRWLCEHAGVNSRHYKPETLKRRIPACLRALRVSTVAHARVAAQRQPALASSAVNALLIGVTSFFRDETVFTTLRERFVPELASRIDSLPGGAKVWSVGCSDGSELYSLAMLLAESGALHRCHLLGTDCRPEAIVRAREGHFEAGSVKPVSRELMEKYFSFDGSRWRVQPCLRAGLHWRAGDALCAPEPGPWDLIACRNMAIYLQPEAMALLWSNLETALRPGGLLVLGKAERPLGTRLLSAVGPCIYRRDKG